MLNMAVATKGQFWTSRVNGEDPESPIQPHHNLEFDKTGTGGAIDGTYWKITGSQYYSVTPTTTDYTLLVGVYYSDTTNIPTDGTTLMRLDNGTKSVEVQSNGTATGLKLVGATTVTILNLDLTMVEEIPYISILRLTLTSAGAAVLYVHESLHDEMGEDLFYSVTGASGSSKIIKWGSDDGTTRWGSTYATTHGAFSPDELAQSAFYQQTLNDLGMALRNLLRDSRRLNLKSLDDSKIMYGFDLSSAMIVRVAPPTIHILVAGIESPNWAALSGTSVEQEYDVQFFITTKGTDYENAYRFGLRIMGEVFDEVYTSTGLNATTDSVIGYGASFDSKLDSDEQICVHRLTFKYMRREKMLMR